MGTIDYSRALVPVPAGLHAARERRISLTLSHPTVLDAALAIIRAHGELGVVLYPGPPSGWGYRGQRLIG